MLELGPKKFAEWTLKQKRLLITDTTFRDAHQSLMATRVRTFDMAAIAGAVARRAPELFSLEMWGGATFDTAMRFLNEDPWQRLRLLREKVPNICFQMLLRGANAVGYTSYPPNVVAGFVKHAAEAGMDIFRVFDSLNDLKATCAPRWKRCKRRTRFARAALCYTGDILDPARSKYSLKYYVSGSRRNWRRWARISSRSKTWRGCAVRTPRSALVKALKTRSGIPVHFHTHDTSGINAGRRSSARADAGVRCGRSGDRVDERLDLAAELELDRRRAANTRRATLGLDVDTLNEFSDYWEQVRTFLRALRHRAEKPAAPRSISTKCPAGNTRTSRSRRRRWGSAHAGRKSRGPTRGERSLRRHREGHAVVSKVVGDMALFLFTRGIKPADVVNLSPGSFGWPESVIDMLSGGLGEPMGGWPPAVVKAVLGSAKQPEARETRAGEAKGNEAPSVAAKLKRDAERRRPLLAPHVSISVFADFAKFQREFGDVSALPTPAFFYGLKVPVRKSASRSKKARCSSSS